MAQMSRSFRVVPLAFALAAALAWNTCVRAQPASAADLPDQARHAAWSGQLDTAISMMNAWIARHPEDRAARMDGARFLAWRGDYAAAIAGLNALAPDNDEVRALRARILAWAGKRNAALAINTPLYEADPGNYDLAWTQALALRLGEWPQQALPALATVRQDKPDASDTRSLVEAVRLPLFSWVELPASAYRDSDGIDLQRIGADASLRVSDSWRLLAGGELRRESVDLPSPYAPVDGDDSVDDRRVQAGARWAISPRSALEFRLGESNLSGGGDKAIWDVSFSQEASDDFDYSLSLDRDRVAFSPRSLSLGITSTQAAVAFDWRPGLRDTLSGRVEYTGLSDDNHARGASADYRHAVYRGERVNLDLGGQVEWHSYAAKPDDGYYSPNRYLRIAPLVGVYFKLGPELGLAMQAVVGAQKDETLSGWKRADDVSAELTMGIYRHWQLVARAGYSDRLHEFGAYQGRSVGLQLRYRFCEFAADRCPRP